VGHALLPKGAQQQAQGVQGWERPLLG
jgi:hypothetical protein